jgi:hypothetical protein
MHFADFLECLNELKNHYLAKKAATNPWELAVAFVLFAYSSLKWTPLGFCLFILDEEKWDGGGGYSL